MKLSEKNIIKIWDEKNNFSILPERWAIVTSIILDSKEILFQEMLENTLFDETKSVRGGIPIMFPQTGIFTEEVQEKLGYFLPQHWIARIYFWEVLEIWKDFINLRFDEKMQVSEYKIPQKFEIFLTYKIEKNFFKIFMKIKNNDEKDLPISHGFHPYFSVPNNWKNSIIWPSDKFEKINSTLYFPTKDLTFEEKIFENKSYEEIILENKEIWQKDGTLSLEMPKNWFSFEISEIWKITLNCSEDLKNFWIRSNEENKNFVCVEPAVWNVGNIWKNPVIIKSGEEFESFFEIRFEK